jgi:hydrogenase maturation protein HypF
MTETAMDALLPANGGEAAAGLKINGIVQGVGFRPFVYQLAREHGIRGTVANTSSGVWIHAEGPVKNLMCFCRALEEKAPPLAHITSVQSFPETARGLADFSILPSQGKEETTTLISPDVCVCRDCLKEMFDPEDRRHGYPFINCTNCGPRYTIISGIPYDRPSTSMKHFKMCTRCQAEYDDPGNRRFHAQPNACPECGPQVSLWDNNRRQIKTDTPIREAARQIKAGHIVAVKGLGGFHLAADAQNQNAVLRLRARKHREEKPFALMSPTLDHIRRYARIRPDEERLLTSPQRPIVLLEKKYPHLIADAAAPGNRYFGVMLPYTPLHYLLLDAEGPESPDFIALVMTSGNMSEEPIAIDNAEAGDRLSHIADYFLIHNRDIYLRSDDTILRHTAGKVRLIRRSRGYVPRPVFLKSPVPMILACGGELKNTICLTKGSNAFLSQHIGDMENLETLNFFTMTVAHMERILDIRPEIIARDLHPDYMSTGYALEQKGVQTIGIQHHHAHIVSCMAENQMEEPVIGLAFDGTGYGPDGAVWGGEILIAAPGEFRRAAHLSYVPLPGSAAAIREPWRMALAYLIETFGESLWNLDLPFLKTIAEKDAGIIRSMIQKKINTPGTSSMGRFFDGISAMLGLKQRASFEGQAAMMLEMTADETVDGHYACEWTSGEIRQILLQSIVEGVARDIGKGISAPVISGKFHNTLIRVFSDLCQVMRKETGLNRAALSGGCFQNTILLKGMIRSLEQAGFEVLTHSLVPANDGGLSLGQALAAAAKNRGATLPGA